MKKGIAQIFLFTFLTVICNSCLTDVPTNTFELELENAPMLLTYLESQGDYINSDYFPSIVYASEVHNNSNSYLLIDVRSPEDFAAGHIINAVNIKPENLLTYLKSINSHNYQKIIIISNTGQSASYYSCLLILDGYTNVYTMKYGMAAWNSYFSSPWTDAINDYPDELLTTDIFPKAGYSKLPSLTFSSSVSTIQAKLEERINILLAEGFEEKLKISYYTPVYDIAGVINQSNPDYYLICLGSHFFYSNSYFGMLHPPGAVNYRFNKPHSELKSINELQTIPSYKIVYLYSYAGHISAFFTAYLRILGYDARSILFGGNNLSYNGMLNIGLEEFVFTQDEINDFEYVTGN